MFLDTSPVPAPVAGGMRENLFRRHMGAKVNGKAVRSDAGSAEGGVDLAFLCGQPVRQICFALWTDATSEV